jgi:hypothetical protein
VALSSIGDEVPSPYAPSYAASKAGLSSYLAGLALALRPRGVRVTNVRLGFVDTKMAKAPVKPMMIPVGCAVEVVMRGLERRPARVTYPWRMAALVGQKRLMLIPELFYGTYAEVKPKARRFLKALASGTVGDLAMLDAAATPGLLVVDSSWPLNTDTKHFQMYVPINLATGVIPRDHNRLVQLFGYFVAQPPWGPLAVMGQDASFVPRDARQRT